MRWKTSFRAGRGRRDRFGDARREDSLHIRQDDPTLADPDTDDDDLDDGPDTDTEDDDGWPSPTGAPPPPPPPTDAPPSSTRSIPTLTPIFHTSVPFTTTTSGHGVKTITPPHDLTFSTVTTSTSSRQSTATATSVVGITSTTTIGVGIIASATGTGQTSALNVMRPEESDPPLVGSPSSRSGLSAGAKAGIAIGTIAAVSLLAALAFLVFKRRARRDNSTPPKPDHTHNHNPPGGTRTQSQIIADMMASAQAMQNGGLSDPYPNEKSPNPLSGGEQPQIRTSIASWLRRHHPLNLNPQSERASTVSARKAPSLTSLPKTPSQASYPKTPITDVSPRTTTISLDSPERKPLPDSNKGKFISVWSNSTPSTTSGGNRNTVSSSGEGGETAILSMYGRGFDSIRGTWVLPPRPLDRDSVTPSQSVSQRGSRVG